MADKTKPLLVDRYLATSPSRDGLVTRRTAERVRERLRAARAFVLDDAATDRYADVVRDIPDLVVRQAEFARAPFDICWFEFDLRRFHERVTGTPSDDKADLNIGYLVDHGTLYTVSGGSLAEPDATPRLLPVAYHLHEPWSLAEQVAFCAEMRIDPATLDAFFWGESVVHLDRDTRRALRHQNSCEFLVRDGVDKPSAFRAFLSGGAGEVRSAIALLLMMNRPSVTSFVRDVPSARRFVKGKLRPFMSHTVVTVPLDPRPTLLRLGTPDDDAVARRRHEVRGHFCHDLAAKRGRARACEHVWARDDEHDDPENHWRCAGCGGRRWWRRAHERGDAGVGYVAKHYAVAG